MRWACWNWIRSGEKKRIPILAFTAHAYKEDEIKIIEAGCDGHVTKPIKKTMLLEIVDKYSRDSSRSS